jgi:hypothetical protein
MVSDISLLRLTQLHEVDCEGFGKNSGNRRCGLIPPGDSMPVKGPVLPSDLTVAEWAILGTFVPPASHVGRARKWPMLRILDACRICCSAVFRGGCCHLVFHQRPRCSAISTHGAIVAYGKRSIIICRRRTAGARGHHQSLSVAAACVC